MKITKKRKSVHRPVVPVATTSLSVQPSSSRSIVVIAVALAMLVSVVGTFIVLNELSAVEKSIDALQAHRALNAMIVKQQEKNTYDLSETPQVTTLSGEVSIKIGE
ncbi:MAG: hypothetical protein HY363_01520 [Candidatus Aenigmarchaeota archaeon]|nr:hypothetical protein [Candidatus Aenigmarchaeota archaeon]